MIREFICGFLIGLANLVPGISGGTIAVVLGIYEKLIMAIVGILKLKFSKDQLKMVSFVGAGLAISIVLGSKFVNWSLNHAAGFTYAAFFGFVVGTVPFLAKQLGKIKIHYIVFGIIIFLFLEYSSISFNTSKFLFPVVGFISAFAMVIPGLSGSLVMLIFGVYNDVLSAVSSMKIDLLFLFGFGAIFGLIFASIFMKYLFEKFLVQTRNFIFGLVIASLLKIQPFDKQSFSLYGYLCVMVVIIITGLASFQLAKSSKLEQG